MTWPPSQYTYDVSEDLSTLYDTWDCTCFLKAATVTEKLELERALGEWQKEPA